MTPLAIPFFRYRTAFHARLLRLAHRIILPSSFLLPFWARYVPASRLVVVPYGVDHATLRDSPHRDGVRFGYVGTIRPHKGLHVLVEALKNAGAAGASLDIWGDPQTDVEYTQRLRAMARGASIVFKGPFRHDHLDDVLSNIDVLVVPSLWAETGPLVVLEAFATGVPVIGSDLGGIRERILRHGNGLLFPPGDVERLSALLRASAKGEAEWPPPRNPVPDLPENLEGVLQAYRKSVLLSSASPSARMWADSGSPSPKTVTNEDTSKVTVAIPCKNGSRYVNRCVDSLREQTEGPHRIILVDDASTDDSAGVAKTLRVEVISLLKWSGLAAARNAALDAAGTSVLVYVDVDTEAMPDTIKRFMPWFDDPRVAAVVGQGIECPSRGLANRWRRIFWRQDQGPDVLLQTTLLSGMCCAVRTERLRAMGGFDERYRTNGEDVDLGLRLLALGETVVYDPCVVVLHHRHDSLLSLCRLTARHTYWQVLALRANGKPWSRALWNAARWIPVCVGSSILHHRSAILAVVSLMAAGCSLLGGVAALSPKPPSRPEPHSSKRKMGVQPS